MKNFFIWISFFVFPLSVFAHKDPVLQIGKWRGVLQLNDSTELPFSFEIDHAGLNYSDPFFLTVINGEEKIVVDNFHMDMDSVSWHMPVFDSYFRCKRESDTSFTGTFTDNAASHPYTIPFHAEKGKARFTDNSICFTTFSFDGKWEVHFSPGTSDSSNAIGEFSYSGDTITGTFATETGDYRFLEGHTINCNGIALSGFDGSHAVLFTAKSQPDGTLKGDFWFGNYWHEKWIAKRNENYELRDPKKLCTVTDSSKVNFTFHDLNGNPVSLSDPRFKGKVVVVQVLGSWCPNCMDETKWLSGVYKKYHAQGLEVIALCYERSADSAVANANIRRLQAHFGADYIFLNTGKLPKDASASLPFLSGIASFPTAIYIGRDGKVKRVFTGYNGPATGTYYTKDTEDALHFIQQLLAEKR